MKTETKWAVIAAIVTFIWLILEKMLGLQTAENFGTWAIVDIAASMLIFTVVYYLFCREKREEDFNGVMSWAEGFWAAAIMTLIFIPISTLLIYLFAILINPDFVHILAEKSSEGSIAIDPYGSFLKQHVFSAIVFGLLFSLLFPIFTKRSAD
jgi:hypothetical protein